MKSRSSEHDYGLHSNTLSKNEKEGDGILCQQPVDREKEQEYEVVHGTC